MMQGMFLSMYFCINAIMDSVLVHWATSAENPPLSRAIRANTLACAISPILDPIFSARSCRVGRKVGSGLGVSFFGVPPAALISSISFSRLDLALGSRAAGRGVDGCCMGESLYFDSNSAYQKFMTMLSAVRPQVGPT